MNIITNSGSLPIHEDSRRFTPAMWDEYHDSFNTARHGPKARIHNVLHFLYALMVTNQSLPAKRRISLSLEDDLIWRELILDEVLYDCILTVLKAKLPHCEAPVHTNRPVENAEEYEKQIAFQKKVLKRLFKTDTQPQPQSGNSDVLAPLPAFGVDVSKKAREGLKRNSEWNRPTNPMSESDPNKNEKKRTRTGGWITVTITTLTYKTFGLDVRLFDQVLVLKEKIQDREGIPRDQIRLLYADKQLSDVKTLSDYDIQHKSDIKMVLKLRGC